LLVFLATLFKYLKLQLNEVVSLSGEEGHGVICMICNKNVTKKQTKRLVFWLVNGT